MCLIFSYWGNIDDNKIMWEMYIYNKEIFYECCFRIEGIIIYVYENIVCR